MTKAQTIDSFFRSFGIEAYPSNRVPNDVIFPYLTYEQTSANYGNSSHPRVTIWYRTDSEIPINAMAETISRAIGEGKSFPCDDGVIVIYFEESWQPITDSVDDAITGRTTNLTITFNTL